MKPSYRRWESVVLITLLGLLVSLSSFFFIFGQVLTVPDLGLLLLFLALLFSGGFALRTLRRKVFFGSHHSLHQAFSFEALFQGALLFYPQMPYPAVEMAFIQQQTNLSAPQVQGWFQLRPAAAIIIPVFMLGVILWLAAFPLWAAVMWLICLIGLVDVSSASKNGRLTYAPHWRFFLAMALGVAAVFWEGSFFLLAGQHMLPEVPSWQWWCLYAVTLTCFELSPIPFALGVLELGFLCLTLFLVLPPASLVLPLAYRLVRASPVTALLLFYLPRYKLSLLDLYQPNLDEMLKRSWPRTHPVHGERESGSPKLSVVIPAFNEEKRLPAYLKAVVDFCQLHHKDAEIIVVDDGSTDGTSNYVRSVQKQFPQIRLLVQNRNQGKGAAVRRGILESRGAYVLFADADGSTPIEEVEVLLASASQGADVAIASRRLGGSTAMRTLFRNLMGTIFYRLTNLLAVPGISDTQCGFKLCRRKAADKLFSMLKEDGWAFDVEMLYLAQKLGMTIVEVPVHWTAVEGSKVSPLKEAVKMFSALWRIRQRWGGLYTEGL